MYHDNWSTDMGYSPLVYRHLVYTMTFLAEIEAGVIKRILYQYKLD